MSGAVVLAALASGFLLLQRVLRRRLDSATTALTRRAGKRHATGPGLSSGS